MTAEFETLVVQRYCVLLLTTVVNSVGLEILPESEKWSVSKLSVTLLYTEMTVVVRFLFSVCYSSTYIVTTIYKIYACNVDFGIWNIAILIT